MPQRRAPRTLPALARQIPQWHHEHWNGDGYPDRRPADAIPVSARLMAAAEVFDAIISRRSYKNPWPRRRRAP